MLFQTFKVMFIQPNLSLKAKSLIITVTVLIPITLLTENPAIPHQFHPYQKKKEESESLDP